MSDKDEEIRRLQRTVKELQGDLTTTKQNMARVIQREIAGQTANIENELKKVLAMKAHYEELLGQGIPIVQEITVSPLEVEDAVDGAE